MCLANVTCQAVTVSPISQQSYLCSASSEALNSSALEDSGSTSINTLIKCEPEICLKVKLSDYLDFKLGIQILDKIMEISLMRSKIRNTTIKSIWSWFDDASFVTWFEDCTMNCVHRRFQERQHISD